MSDADGLVVSGYDAFYAAWGSSSTLRRIWRDHVTGPDHPEEFAHISFLPFDQLRGLAEGLDLRADDVLVDLACGAGGPGLWVAKRFGARLRGVDLSPVAVARATERAREVGMARRSTFIQGSFEQTELPAASVDAVMTVDALQYAPSKASAVAEVARILRSGRRFGFVAFELDAERVAGLPLWPDPVGDFRPLLDAAGFEVLRYEQLLGWQDLVAAGFGAVVDERAALESELGHAATAALVAEASMTLGLRPYRGHVLGIAERR